MKKNIGIWIDTSKAFIVKISNNKHSIKKIESNIDTRERVAGETKKYGRFGGQYLTYEKNRENRRNEQTSLYLKNLLKEIENCNSLVLFGPAGMKNLLKKEITNNMLIAKKLVGIANSDELTQNQMVAWVKNFFNKNVSISN